MQVTKQVSYVLTVTIERERVALAQLLDPLTEDDGVAADIWNKLQEAVARQQVRNDGATTVSFLVTAGEAEELRVWAVRECKRRDQTDEMVSWTGALGHIARQLQRIA